MNDPLVAFFEDHISLTSEDKEILQNEIPIRKIKKGEVLLSEGEVSNEFYFLLEGSVRLYYDVDGEEKTAFFYFENMFVSSYESFTKRTPAKHYLQATEDITVRVISCELAYELLERSPKFEFLARIMMEEELIVCQEIISSFVTLNAEKRYLKLLEENSPILQRVPQHQLATYLGVTPETLSRIRKRIATNIS